MTFNDSYYADFFETPRELLYLMVRKRINNVTKLQFEQKLVNIRQERWDFSECFLFVIYIVELLLKYIPISMRITLLIAIFSPTPEPVKHILKIKLLT